MKTRRNKGRNKTRKGRNKTRKGRKGRRTYKTRYGGGVNFDPVEFLKIEKELREKKEKKEKAERNKIEAERNKIEKEKKQQNEEKKQQEERNKIEEEESRRNQNFITLKDIYITKKEIYPKIKDTFTQFLAKLNDIQRKEIEDNKNKFDITNILTHYIELKYRLRTLSTRASGRNSKYYDDRTYNEYMNDSFDTRRY